MLLLLLLLQQSYKDDHCLLCTQKIVQQFRTQQQQQHFCSRNFPFRAWVNAKSVQVTVFFVQENINIDPITT